MTLIRLEPWLLDLLRRYFGQVWEQFPAEQRRWIEQMAAGDGSVTVPLTEDQAMYFSWLIGTRTEACHDALQLLPSAPPFQRSVEPVRRSVARRLAKRTAPQRLRRIPVTGYAACGRVTAMAGEIPTHSTLTGGELRGVHLNDVVPFSEMEEVPGMGRFMKQIRHGHG